MAPQPTTNIVMSFWLEYPVCRLYQRRRWNQYRTVTRRRKSCCRVPWDRTREHNNKAAYNRDVTIRRVQFIRTLNKSFSKLRFHEIYSHTSSLVEVRKESKGIRVLQLVRKHPQQQKYYIRKYITPCNMAVSVPGARFCDEISSRPNCFPPL